MSDLNQVHFFIGSDHAGFQLKSQLIAVLKEKNIAFTDFGPSTNASCQYPLHAIEVARAVQKSESLSRGLLICGSGMGVSLVANKFQGIRAGLCRDVEDARMAREHNDINVLCLGERRTPLAEAVLILEAFLTTSFAGGRHQERLSLFQNLGTPQ
jgi:ribose 5-phosphate isomerase B